MQHLSCSSCKRPYEAQFKNGVLRTTFSITPQASTDRGLSAAWIIAILAAVIALLLRF